MDLTWSPVDSFQGNFTSASLERWRRCPVCGSDRSRARVTLNGFQFYGDSSDVPKRFDVRHVQCADCAALYMNPCYSAFGFATLFAEAGQSYGSVRQGEQRDWLGQRGFLRPGDHVFDVGCYEGRFLASLPAETRRTGIDCDRPAIERARSRLAGQGIELILGDFDAFVYDSHPDTITMFHVLEHLPDPIPALARLRSIAHDRTRLVVEVPVLERASTNDINGFLTVQHLTHFSVGSLNACLHRGGWDPIDEFAPDGYNGWRVIAQPGASRASSTQPDDVERCDDHLERWRHAVDALVRRLEPCSSDRAVVVWGSGTHTELLYHLTPLFRSDAGRRFALVDADPIKQGTTWRGIAVHPPGAIQSVRWTDARLVISSYGSQNAIADAAVEMGVPDDRVVRLYEYTSSY